MKFSANAGKLIQAVSPAVNVATKSIVDKEIEGTFKVELEVAKQSLIIKARTKLVYASMPIVDDLTDMVGYTFIEDGSAVVNAIDLMNCLKTFGKDEQLIVSADGSELTITMGSDTEQFQTVPLQIEEIKPHTLAKMFTKECEINRKIFCAAIKKVLFAIGWDNNSTKERYLYASISPNDNGLRIACGSGGRFAVLDIEGKTIVTSHRGGEIRLHRDQMDAVLSVLGASDAETVKIKQSDPALDDPGNPHQVTIEYYNNILILTGINPDSPSFENDVKKIFAQSSQCHVVTKLSDWAPSVHGIRVTFNEEYKKTHMNHPVKISVDCDKKIINLETTKSKMRAKRKLPIGEIKKRDDQENVISFSADSLFLSEMVANADNTSDIEIEIIQRKGKPIIIVKNPKISNEVLGTEEQFTMFFSTLAQA